MSMSMYQASVPVFVRALGNLDENLTKGGAYAASRGAAPDTLLNARLFFDMFPLVKQVQIATDTAKGCVARLADVETMKFEDNETTLDALHARIQRARDYIGSFTAAQIDGTEARAITLKQRSGEQHFTGAAYLTEFALPNFFFHCVTAYNILRVAGTGIGKRDFLAGVDQT